MMDPDWLCTFDNIALNALPEVGHKAFNLATLHRNGLDVPPGVVVTTRFFEAQINHLAYGPLWAGSPDVAVTAGALAFVADSLKTRPLAPHLEQSLQTKLAEYFPDSQYYFAVRSSAIDEDLPQRSFAGLYLSELNVPRDLIAISLTRCWASALNGRAIAYRLEHGLPLQAIRLAVIIQPMVSATVAGVAFTRNPLNPHDDTMLVEAAAGLGQALVSGHATPQQYQLPRRTSSAQPPSASDPADPLLSAATLQTLCTILQQIEALMGRPQDVEWAISDDRLYLLQTRPISSSAPATISTDGEWGRVDLPALLPPLPSPMCLSLLQRLSSALYRTLTAWGVDIPTTEAPFKTVFGRLYLNLGLVRRALSHLRLPTTHLLYHGYSSSDDPQSSQLKPAHLVGYYRFWRWLQVRYRQLAAEQSRLRQCVDALNALAGDAPARLAQFRQREQVYEIVLQQQLPAGLLLDGILMAAQALVPAAGPAFDQPAWWPAAQVLTGLDYQAALPPDYADYALAWLDPAMPRFAEQRLGNMASERDHVAARDLQQLLTSWQQAFDGAAGQLPPWDGRRLFLSFLCRRGELVLRWRYAITRTQMQTLAALRRWDLAMAQSWVESGLLDAIDDYFWMTATEIEQLLMHQDPLSWHSQAEIQSRRAQQADEALIELPAVLRDSDLPHLAAGADIGAVTLLGIPISPGQMQGVIAVLVDGEPSFELSADTILVAGANQPGLERYFGRIGGLVVEQGGILSHGSILAREYGIPAVSGIPQARQVLQTGDRVLLDGSTGIVQVLHRVE